MSDNSIIDIIKDVYQKSEIKIRHHDGLIEVIPTYGGVSIKGVESGVLLTYLNLSFKFVQTYVPASLLFSIEAKSVFTY